MWFGKRSHYPLQGADLSGAKGGLQTEQLAGAAQLQVFSFIHHTHPAAPDPARDAVMGNRLPHGLRGSRHWLDMLGGDEGEVNQDGGSVWRRQNAPLPE